MSGANQLYWANEAARLIRSSEGALAQAEQALSILRETGSSGVFNEHVVARSVSAARRSTSKALETIRGRAERHADRLQEVGG